MNSFLLQDLDARRSALDVSRSFVVQAPAGSGKTELLIQRYLTLLAGVDQPEEVLAITFTRKAAAEMLQRIVRALESVTAAEPPQESHRRLTYDLALSVCARDKTLGWSLTANPQRMRIMTMDALNASLTRSRPLSAPDNLAGARLAVDGELLAVHQDAARATLDWLGDKSAANDAIETVLTHLDNNTSRYESYLAQMLATRDQWLPFVGSGVLNAKEAAELRQVFEANLRQAIETDLEHLSDAMLPFAQIAASFQTIAENGFASGESDSPLCELAPLTTLPASEVDAVPAWKGVAELLLVRGKSEFRKTVNKNQGFPTTVKIEKKSFIEQLDIIRERNDIAAMLHGIRSLPPGRYTDEQWIVLLALFRLLPLAVVELRRLFAERRMSDHVEVALSASDALGSADSPGDVALMLDYRISHILIDEMQDTSSAQYQMLDALMGGWQDNDGRTLFCVGDPMQSVYRFRNAEVGQFLLAKENGIGSVRLRSLVLRQNFRSVANLVDWYNTVFPSVLAATDDSASAAISYTPAAAALPRDESAGCFVHPVIGTLIGDEVSIASDVISNIVAQNSQDSVAVLVRSRTQLPLLLAELRKTGVAYQAIEIDRLTDLPEIIEVLALTRAAVHLSDRVAWLALLRAPWIGLAWADIRLLVENSPKSTVWTLLQDAARLQRLSDAAQERLDNAMDSLRALTLSRPLESLRSLVERIWMQLGGPALLQTDDALENVHRYFDVLERLEAGGTLTDVADLESQLDMERVSSTSTASVQVMTIHKSKGLEFDHVVLFGLGRKSGRSEKRVLSWCDMPTAAGREQKIIGPLGSASEVENDPVHQFIAYKDAQKDDFEQGRLLYVACTRAMKTLHLVGNTAVSKQGENLSPARKDSLLIRLWHAVEGDFEAAFEQSQCNVRPMAVAESEPLLDAPLKRFARQWRLPQPNLLPVALMQAAPDVDPEETEFYWVGNEARIAGTLVHRWLHRMAIDFALNAAIEPANRRQITLRWMRETGYTESFSLPVVQRVEDALERMLSDEKGRWLLNGGGHAELALTGNVGGELASVIIDRIRIDENGVHWIVDYKTSSHEGGDLRQFLAVESERYRAQVERYRLIYAAWAGTEARCALYFPLLQQFVELDSEVSST